MIKKLKEIFCYFLKHNFKRTLKIVQTNEFLMYCHRCNNFFIYDEETKTLLPVDLDTEEIYSRRGIELKPMKQRLKKLL